MSLYESPSFDVNEPSFVPLASAATPIHTVEPIERLSSALEGVLMIRKREPVQRNVPGFVFTGMLLGSPDTLYRVVVDRFRLLGYTPVLERYHGEDVVIALPGVARTRRLNTPWWLHLGLLIVTLISTLASGAMLGGYAVRDLWRAAFVTHNVPLLWHAAIVGAPFALTLLLILGVHEMGHYVAARLHGVRVTLPFFIPLPIIGLLGTLGAVIFIKDPLANRKSLFDVGISGPLAGLIVSLPAFVIGLQLPVADPTHAALHVFQGSFGGWQFSGLGMPPLLEWLGHLVTKAPLAYAVLDHPVALAAWFGVLLTVLNLLPIGQLDGGHVMYTLFGRFAWVIALATFGVLLILGLTVYQSFLFYAFLALITGLRHPPPGNDITPLDPLRKAIGVGTIVLFGLIVTVTPFIVQQ